MEKIYTIYMLKIIISMSRKLMRKRKQKSNHRSSQEFTWFSRNGCRDIPFFVHVKKPRVTFSRLSKLKLE